MHGRRPFSIAVALAAAALVAACSPPRKLELTVVARDLRFSPRDLEVRRGQPVRVTFRNEDLVVHDWVVLNIPASGKLERSDGHPESLDPVGSVHVGAEVGRVGSVEFVPEQAGTYTVICSVAGHKDMGMKGTLTVK